MAIIRDGKHMFATDGDDIWLKMALANIRLALLYHRSKISRLHNFSLLFDAAEYVERYFEKDESSKISASALAQFKKDIKW